MRPQRLVRPAVAWRRSLSCVLGFLVLISQSLPFVQALPASALETSAGGNTTSSLTVERGTTHVVDVSDHSVLKLTGNLRNSGALYVVSTNPNVTNATIRARNIFNAAGALVTTLLPEGGLPGVTNAISNLSLSLVAVRNIVNHGTISSANKLTVGAGGTIVNASGVASSTAVMQAVNNLNLNASVIMNQGVLTSTKANVNIATTAATLQNIVNIDNTLGTISALNGAVNVGCAGLVKNSVLSILGGTISAPQINLDGGAGTVRAMLDSTMGLVNVTAGIAQVGTRSGDLNLGKLTIRGDPTFFNSDGDINIQDNIDARDNLAILAKGNISCTDWRLIQTTDLSGLGHDIYMVAGGDLTATGKPKPVSTPDIPPHPPDHPLLDNQFVTVSGPSSTGGSISLKGSMLDTHSTSGDNNGGNVTLVAYAGNGTGGVEDLEIKTGGFGAGRNGAVTVIAGGSLLDSGDPSNTAIKNVKIDASGGTGVVTAPISLFAATPTGSITFNSQGLPASTSGALLPFTPTARDIFVTAPIKTDGGTITAVTGGLFSNTAAIESSGGITAGRRAGDIVISAGTIDIEAPVKAIGANGADGVTPGAGLAGPAGGTGGGGGKIILLGSNGITVNGDIKADGGRGGKGGDGGSSTQGGGGNGGSGGDGGLAGSITLSTLDSAINQSVNKVMTAIGGFGGAGGAGGSGGTNGGRGGDGGAAGAAMRGGTITVSTGTGDLTLNGTVDASAGDGGGGGAGGNGGNGTAKGGDGGNSGTSSAGAIGGTMGLTTSSGQITLATGKVNGGKGGSSGTSGSGGTGVQGGDGGLIGVSGAGGKGGSMTLLSTTGGITLSKDIQANGGAGGNLNNTAGAGGTGTTAGGSGGGILNAGGGGKGGIISASTAGAIDVGGSVQAVGGSGGSIGGTGGDGATGGGNGGSLGNAGGGGDGGGVQIQGGGNINVAGADIFHLSFIDVSGGNGGAQSGKGGKGVDGPIGGAGGSVGNSGAGGAGGSVSIKTVKTGSGLLFFDNGYVAANGGDGGVYTGTGGQGGKGLTGNGGNGGFVGNQGNAGDGGKISLTGSDLHMTATATLVANGGQAPGYNGTGGDGGDAGGSGRGGNGGGALNAGNAGAGGSITCDIPGTVMIDEHFHAGDAIAARGGSVAEDKAHSGKGGKGGPGSDEGADGGFGGNIGNNGSAGKGGKITIIGDTGVMTGTSFDHSANVSGVLAVAGGHVKKNSTVSGAGGDAGPNGDGGFSGSIGNNGSGGDGGEITLSSVSGRIVLSTLIAAGGDIDGPDSPTTGKGGDGGGTSGNGGNSGRIGNNGRGGNGGRISISTLTGDIGAVEGGNTVTYLSAAGVILSMGAVTGNGGTAVEGDGGTSGSIGNNGRAGNGGIILLSSLTGNIKTPRGGILVPGADGGVMFDATGTGGNTNLGTGGDSGSIGNNSSGGDGGVVKISTLLGSISVVGVIIASGGITRGALNTTGDAGSSLAGNGGNSGNIGNNGNGGKGGTVEIFSGGLTQQIKPDDQQTSEAIVANGGSCAVEGIASRTGQGGNGSSQGGNSGSIGNAGVAGDGGEVSVTSVFGNIHPDRILVNGGGAGDLPFFPFTPGGTGPMMGRSGDGGNGAGANGGGNAGGVGNGVVGGNGGKITLFAGSSILESVDFQADGGLGGLEAGIGGKGGTGGKAGGKGGSVGGGGGGGNAGSISLTANAGPITIKELQAFGGIGGDNSATGGLGGNGLFAGGNGGDIGGSGGGGKGGTVKVEVKLAGSAINLVGNEHLRAYGGFGGLLSGTAGDGGDGGTATQNNATGGNGGFVGMTGGGGVGGNMSFIVPGGTMTMMDGANLNGGDSGACTATAGNGGKGNGAGAGGRGGDVGDQFAAGSAVKNAFSFSGNTLILNTAQLISANGGTGLLYQPTSGKGGAGGGQGGDGGDCGASGSGGDGGWVTIKSSNSVQVNGSISVDGGNRNAVFEKSGAGGNAGPGGGSGGNGGMIADSGNAGGGGKIVIECKFGTVTGNGLLRSVGGSVFTGLNIEIAGDGGDGKQAGGNGGSVGHYADAGGGGKILVDAQSDITIPTYQVFGGDNLGTFDARAGKGGNGGQLGGDGGQGGTVGDNGKAGSGGSVSLKSFLGTISAGAITANGGSVGVMHATGGDGGSQTLGAGDGGVGGGVGANGNGGIGGKIEVSTQGEIHSSDDWDVSGGNVGAYQSVSGSGGASGSGSGGAGGQLGDQGDAGDAGGLTNGGGIGIKGLDAVVNLLGNLLANGGSIIGNYTGRSGNGGSGGAAGGPALSTGTNGSAGTGGVVSIETRVGKILGSSVNAAAGTGSVHEGEGGDGGEATSVRGPGGIGGSVDKGSAGGGGGKITVFSKTGSISFSSDLLATGSAGGENFGFAGRGGDGVATGGNGGAVDRPGSGGRGGDIIITTKGSLTTAGQIKADGANGGDQSGLGGNGGDAAPSGVGGAGGDLRSPGAGGDGGTVIITVPVAKRLISIPPTANPGAAGANGGMPGFGGSPDGRDGQRGPAARPGQDGTVKFVPQAMLDDDCDDFQKKKRKRNDVMIASLDNDIVPVSYMQYAAPNLVRAFTIPSSAATLYAPKQPIEIRTAQWVLHVGAGSKVLVERQNGETVIRNLHDHKQGDVRVTVGDTTLSINLGHQLVLTRNIEAACDNSSLIATRNAVARPLPGGMLATLSEFSFVSAFTNHETLKALYRSTAKEDRRDVAQIIKNACALSFAAAKTEPYRTNRTR